MTPRLRYALGEREEDVQRAIIEALAFLGYTVLQTTVRKRKCPNCGAVDHRGYGATRGVGDLLVWIAGAWRMLEVKGPLTPLSPEQKEAERLGRLVVVRSINEAIAAVREWENP